MNTNLSGRALVWRAGLAVLTLTLLVGGCKKGTKAGKAEEDEGPSREDIKRGIGRQLPAVARVEPSTDLRTIGQLYFNYVTQQGRAPSGPEDLELQKADGRLYKLVKDGEYVVLWDINVQGGGNPVIAYQKDAPTKGGVAAKLDGSTGRVAPGEITAEARPGGQ